nr:hypothetical protein CFP56_56324 [Quercus suber]
MPTKPTTFCLFFIFGSTPIPLPSLTTPSPTRSRKTRINLGSTFAHFFGAMRNLASPKMKPARPMERQLKRMMLVNLRKEAGEGRFWAWNNLGDEGMVVVL